MRFKQWDCELKFGQYGNGRTAIQLIDKKDRDLVAVATVNMENDPLEADEVFIKDYSENEGMLQALINAGIVKDTGERVASGWVMIPKAKLLINVERK